MHHDSDRRPCAATEYELVGRGLDTVRTMLAEGQDERLGTSSSPRSCEAKPCLLAHLPWLENAAAAHYRDLPLPVAGRITSKIQKEPRRMLSRSTRPFQCSDCFCSYAGFKLNSLDDLGTFPAFTAGSGLDKRTIIEYWLSIIGVNLQEQMEYIVDSCPIILAKGPRSGRFNKKLLSFVEKSKSIHHILMFFGRS